MAFAQLTYRESLRDVETCLRAMHSKLYHVGIKGRVSRSTLADANERRDWRIYADFGRVLIQMARKLYADEDLAKELTHSIYALDCTVIHLCLSMFPWTHFRQSQGAIKLHTLLDVRTSIPSFIHVTPAKVHELNILDQLIPEPGSLYLMDRAYLDFARLYTLHQSLAFFIVRARKDVSLQRLYSHQVDKTTGLRSDQSVRLTSFYPLKYYPEKLRRVSYFDAETNKRLVFLTNNFFLPALNVANFYRCRWQVELFFKWIKQHLRIKKFLGTSENAVKTQLWIAVSIYVLVAIVKKQLKSDLSLYTILQILSVSIFEKIPLNQTLTESDFKFEESTLCKQFSLFNF
jgi:hypothetical protein